jgi:isoleucyl-tRNA synthetase
LGSIAIKKQTLKGQHELLELIKDEINVKEIIFDETLESEIRLDKKITKELKEEGIIRELVRQIQDMRRQAGLTRKDRISINIQISKFPNFKKTADKWGEFIKKETLSQGLTIGEKASSGLEKDIQLEENKIKVGINKIYPVK